MGWKKKEKLCPWSAGMRRCVISGYRGSLRGQMSRGPDWIWRAILGINFAFFVDEHYVDNEGQCPYGRKKI